MTDHPFDEAVALEPLDAAAGRFAGRTHPAWANMVGPYGGITAAQMLAAVLAHPRLLGEPLALTVNFCAGVADGGFELHARPVRTNRTTQHWTVEQTQAGEVVTSATAVTAIRRDTWAHDEHAMPEVPGPSAVAAVQRPEAPAWLARYEMRFLDGGLLESMQAGPADDSLTRLWVRDAPARALDAVSLTALADVFYPRVWRRRGRPGPAGTVSMTVYFHAGADALRAETAPPAGAPDDADAGWLLAQATAQAFRDGFFDQSGQLWSAGGRLLATTHQTVYFKG